LNDRYLQLPIIILGVLINITISTFCDANYRMTSHDNVELEQPKTGLPDSESDREEEAHSEPDLEDAPNSDVDEEEMKKWLSTAYERGSKEPMKKPLTAPWDVPISDGDVEKLKVGFKSRDMDDKWDILIEDPDESGNISIHIIRSWLQEECYILHIVPKPSNYDGGSAKIQSITWEENKGGLQCSGEQAQKEAVMLARGHLNCEFGMLPDYPSSMFWDSSAYKRVEE
jgi:hypothetical protein